jgi:hypothetical protein
MDPFPLTRHYTFGFPANRRRHAPIATTDMSVQMSFPEIAAKRSAIRPRPQAKSNTMERSGLGDSFR